MSPARYFPEGWMLLIMQLSSASGLKFAAIVRYENTSPEVVEKLASRRWQSQENRKLKFFQDSGKYFYVFDDQLDGDKISLDSKNSIPVINQVLNARNTAGVRVVRIGKEGYLLSHYHRKVWELLIEALQTYRKESPSKRLQINLKEVLDMFMEHPASVGATGRLGQSNTQVSDLDTNGFLIYS